MLIRYSPKTKQISIAGSREELTRLASLIRTGSGKMIGDQTVSPKPYPALLTAITIERKTGGAVTFTVAEDNSLSIAGDKNKMDLLATNVQSFAEDSPDNHHWHVEYFPDHFYLAADSFPVVFQFR
jgi:hypothetical protein